MKLDITNKYIDEYINHRVCNCQNNNLHEYIALFSLFMISIFVLKLFFNEVESDMGFQAVFLDDDDDSNFSSEDEDDEKEQEQKEEQEEDQEDNEQGVVNA